MSTSSHKCPVCNGGRFIVYRNRELGQCESCGANERTRVTALFLEKHIRLGPGQRVLHLAPEKQLAPYFIEKVGAGYEPCDFDPARYQGKIPVPVRRLDLCTDLKALESETYDLVLHNHVMEHVPCNWTLVLQGLQRVVKKGGVHLFSIPILKNRYFAEDLNPALTEAQREERFRQRDHVRMFGKLDFASVVAPIFDLPTDYSLERYFSAEELKQAGIRAALWTVGSTSVFLVKKAV